MTKFVKLKDFIASKKPEFALYLLNGRLFQQIEFCNYSEFTARINEVHDWMKGKTFKSDPIDINEIFQESYQIFLSKFLFYYFESPISLLIL